MTYQELIAIAKWVDRRYAKLCKRLQLSLSLSEKEKRGILRMIRRVQKDRDLIVKTHPVVRSTVK